MRMKVNNHLVKELRLRRSWSQEKLADIAGLNLRTVQRIEKNGVASLQARLSIANALEIDPVELDRNDDVSEAVNGNATPPIRRFINDARALLVGVYVALVSLGFGLVILDVVYSNLIIASFPSTDAAFVFSKVADFLLQVGVMTMLVGVCAVYATWSVHRVRLLLLTSMGVKIAIGMIFLVVLNWISPEAQESISKTAGALIRLTMHVASTALAFAASVEYSRHRLGTNAPAVSQTTQPV